MKFLTGCRSNLLVPGVHSIFVTALEILNVTHLESLKTLDIEVDGMYICPG